MFRNRRTSQKPDEELYAAFKENFPGVGPGTTGTSAEVGVSQRSTSLSDAHTDAHIPNRHFTDLDDLKDHDSHPKHPLDSWRFTPSMMDPNSFAFSTFANQPPGYYTPTPGIINTLYHSQAGDLHTPGMGMHLGTPLSMPHSAHGVQAQDSTADLHHFHSMLNQPQFHNPFAQQQSFAPSHFLQHHDSGYEAMDNSPHKSPQNQLEAGMAPPHSQTGPTHTENTMTTIGMPMGEKFRFHTTLIAPTAMIKQPDEIPITYLNKGQAYTMTIFDTAPIPPTNSPIKYRTFIRVSFEDEQQRAKPGACWQLWKEGRGTNEAHQRGGKLLAVEYVDPNQGGDIESRRSQIELESASFDGFCVTWVPNPTNGASECSISVRFNFLSTDFSHSKGVKGIPVRLCAKTEMIMPSPNESSLPSEPEVCFSKVKLFRDHGAERKLSNDVAHVKKTIEKLKQQISQAETGVGSFGKRKRSMSTAKPSGSRPTKVLKHKRTWSLADSDGENSGRLSAEEDLHAKLASMQDMFTSTRPVSILYLRGEDQDDPDLFPVQLPGDQEINPLTRQETWETKPSVASSPTSTVIVSPTPSSATSHNVNRGRPSVGQIPLSAVSRESSDAWQNQPQNPSESPELAVKVPKRESVSSIMAVGIDDSYEAPDPPIKPLACFYVRSKHSTKEYYRAIYLMQRTVKDLVNGISEKFNIDSTRITQVTHINSRGLQIVVDEDVVQQLPEGQDMLVEFSPASTDGPVKSEFINPKATEVVVDSEIGFLASTISDPLEMWLNY